MRRAGPGVLTGLEEADRRGLTPGVFFNVTFRGAAVHCTQYIMHRAQHRVHLGLR
jgi:hypothetical protein